MIEVIVVGIGVSGILLNFCVIFFLDANDRINEDFLEQEKVKNIQYGP